MVVLRLLLEHLSIDMLPELNTLQDRLHPLLLELQ
jgi:hypothetical protein